MTKYYRVKKDNFLWKEGAILQNKADNEGYRAVEDVWDTTPENKEGYIPRRIVEHEGNSDFFERVYQDNTTGKLYRTKDQLVSVYKEVFKQ